MRIRKLFAFKFGNVVVSLFTELDKIKILPRVHVYLFDKSQDVLIRLV